jgi:NADP-dependent aldehyde dehydrogenase
VDAVVHLGALSTEAAWEDLLAVNIDGTRKLLEAMRQQGVGRLVLASSVHAAGFRTRAEADPAPGAGLAAETVPRPDTYYGVSKAATEALASLYHSRFGLDVSCLRIGGLHPHPVSPEDLAVWLSPDDGGRLVEACLGSHPPGFRILWGISRNTRRWWSLAEAEALGYAPQDDAEHWADRILADARFDPAAPRNFLAGGHFCALPLGEPAPAWPPR